MVNSKYFYFPDPCQNIQCGHGSCRAENHEPKCFCQEGYTNDANGRCVDINECANNPCHRTAQCQNVPGSFKCHCRENQVGDPYKTGCEIKAECLTNNDCANTAACENGKCVDPCYEHCGQGAECVVRNHNPVCSCPRRWTGDPRVKCTEMECIENTDCTSELSCVNNQCQDVCSLDGVCGQHSKCTTINHTPFCACNAGFTGDPRIGCSRIINCVRDIECPTNMMCAFGVCAGNSTESRLNYISY